MHVSSCKRWGAPAIAPPTGGLISRGFGPLRLRRVVPHAADPERVELLLAAAAQAGQGPAGAARGKGPGAT